MPAAREDHRGAGPRDGGDHFVVAARAARLDDRGDTGLERELRPVREGEEGVGGERRADGSWPNSAAFSTAIRTASTRLFWPAPMPIVCRSFDEHDGVRGDVLADAPGEDEVAPLRLVKLAGRRAPSRPRSSISESDPGRASRRARACSPARPPLGAPLAVEQDAQCPSCAAARRARPR